MFFALVELFLNITLLSVVIGFMLLLFNISFGITLMLYGIIGFFIGIILLAPSDLHSQLNYYGRQGREANKYWDRENRKKRGN